MLKNEQKCKKQYNRPELKVVKVNISDIIATSDPVGNGRDFNGGEGW